MTLTLTFDLSEDRELKSEPFSFGFICIGHILSVLWPKYVTDLFVTLTLTYQRIGNWKVNILALVSYESDENWACYDINKFLAFSWSWPLTWSLPKSNQLVLGWWQIIPENFMQFGPVVFEASWPWPWPLTWSIPKSNWLVLGWWQIIPENFM